MTNDLKLSRFLPVFAAMLFALQANALSCSQIDTEAKAEEFALNLAQSIAFKRSSLIDIPLASLKNECSREMTALLSKGCFQNLANFKFEPVYEGQSEKEYLAARPAYHFMLPKELENGVPRNWEEIAAQKNWKYIEYISGFVTGSPNLTHRRRLFYVPESDKVTKWIQVSLPYRRGQSESVIDLYDMITVEKRPGDPEGALVSHSQFSRSTGKFYRSNTANSCVRCHSQGLRFILPSPGSIGKSNLSLKEMNMLISEANVKNKGNLSENSILAPAGPPMGKNTGGCVKCHGESSNPRYFGKLTYIHSPSSIEYKVVTSLKMPPDLLKEERFSKLNAAISAVEDLKMEERPELLEGPKRTYEQAFEVLKLRGKITEAEYQRLLVDLSQARSKAKNLLRGVVSEYKLDLARWLVGDNPACAKYQTAIGK